MSVMMRTGGTAPGRRSGRNRNEPTILDPALAHNVIGKMPDLAGRAAQDRHFQAVAGVGVNMQRRDREVVMDFLFIVQALGQIARLVIVDIDQPPHAFARAAAS